MGLSGLAFFVGGYLCFFAAGYAEAFGLGYAMFWSLLGVLCVTWGFLATRRVLSS